MSILIIYLRVGEITSEGLQTQETHYKQSFEQSSIYFPESIFSHFKMGGELWWYLEFLGIKCQFESWHILVVFSFSSVQSPE